jgi:zinc protease
MQTVNFTGNEKTVQKVVLKNGITLIAIENQTADLIAGRLFFKSAGAMWESPQKSGLFHLLATVITKGTKNLSAQEIAEQTESIGASLGADASSDYFVLSLKTVAADFAQMLKLAGEILRFPTFPEAEVEREKQITRQNIRSQLEQPFNVAFNQLRDIMYPNHPYGLSILGTEETVEELTRFDLVECHQDYFRPDNLIISLSGRLNLEDAIALVEEVFGDWEIPPSSLVMPEITQLVPQPNRAITPQETQQSIVMLGYLGAAVKERDYAALKLLSTYLGNGLSSRLFVELREKRGLAYDVSAFYPTRLEKSQFVIYIGTAPNNTAFALEGLRSEAERLRHTELTPQELQAAKNKILGQYALGKQTNAEMAQLFGWYETLGLGIEFDTQFQDAIEQVTVEMVRQVANDYFIEPYISMVGPADSVTSYQ